ncbi:anti-phage deoxyguanosine triphosphatase [Alteromonas lipotrueiana]|uniref:anti-phage deoxyguanosine triphosphatase n=1 Tax=Alteromonas lipotrueiana TaxID=2803815 RepID=UPI001C439891|nr:anti-phage deoxyguanosine triphosphatase [Alteromonas lipotrueiana]
MTQTKVSEPSSPWEARLLPRSIVRDGDHRDSFQRDKARVLHSAAFRRLQAKTQVLGVGLSDFYRTRLTHSLEAAQIGSGITAQLHSKYPELTQQLGLDSNLIETLCLAHDIGHPPFGHGGEVALHFMMHKYGGYEGNGQTFRIVTQLEPYTAEHGMNLCRRSILGLVKYPNYIETLTNAQCYGSVDGALRTIKASQWYPPKGLYRCDENRFNWLLEPLTHNDRETFVQYHFKEGQHHHTCFKSFDCTIMELADDIAYGIHDLEDAIVMNMVNKDQFIAYVVKPLSELEVQGLSKQIMPLSDQLFSQHPYERKNAIGALVNVFITAIRIEENPRFELDLLRYQACLPSSFESALSLFKKFIYEQVICQSQVQVLEYKGQQIVMSLFEAYSSDPERLLPENTKKRWQKAQDENNGHRIIADYISGMTDEFASRHYSTLFAAKGNF